MFAYLVQGRKIDLDEHRDDHHPNQQADRQIDLGKLQPADRLKHSRQNLTQRNPRDDAQEHPNREVTLKNAH